MQTPLTKKMTAVRRRLWGVLAAAGSLWAAAAALIAVALAMWFDLLWELPPELRIATVGAAALAACIAIAFAARIAIRDGRLDRIARRLDAVGQGLAGQGPAGILTGWELAGAQAAAVPELAISPLTPGLVRMAVDQAGESAARIATGTTVALRPAVRALAFVASLAALVAGIAWLAPDLAQTQWLRFVRPFDDIPPYSATTFTVEPGDASVVFGNELTVRATPSGAPVDRVDLVIETPDAPAEVLPMFPESDGRWRATIARVAEPGRYFIRSHRARSCRFDIRLILVPQIGDVRVRIVPPDYTRLPPYVGAPPKEGIAGLPGTKVDLWAASNRPLSGGQLKIAGRAASELKMDISPENPNEAHGAFELAADGKLELRLVDTEGRASREAFTAPISLLADHKPFLRIVQPPPTSYATPSALIPVALAAEDDYGIARLQLFRSLNESRATPLELAMPKAPPRRADETQYLPLSDYGLKPGDAIRLFGRVEDTEPTRHQAAESSVVTLEIISQEDFERMILSQHGLETLLGRYQEARRRMESAAEMLEQLHRELSELPADDPLAHDIRRRIEKIAQKLAEDAAAVQKLAEKPLPFDIDKNLAKQLAEAAKALREAGGDLSQLAAQSPCSNKTAAAGARKAADRLNAGRKDFQQKAMDPLEHLAAAFPLLADAEKFTELAQLQRDLADRAASLKGRDGEDDPELKARCRQLEEEQRQLRDALGSLLAQIEEHTAKLPQRPEFEKLRETAESFVAELKASGAAETMSEAETAMASFLGTKSHAKADEAAKILDRFVKKCQGGMAGQCKGCLAFQPTLSQCLGNSIAQLLAAMGGGGGMGYGSGPGMGAMRGFGNVGLFGSLPGMTGAGNIGSGTSNVTPGAAGAEGSGTFGSGGTNPDQTPGARPVDNNAPGGSGGPAAPSQYRRRVGQYFQRILEEVQQRK